MFLFFFVFICFLFKVLLLLLLLLLFWFWWFFFDFFLFIIVFMNVKEFIRFFFSSVIKYESDYWPHKCGGNWIDDDWGVVVCYVMFKCWFSWMHASGANQCFVWSKINRSLNKQRHNFIVQGVFGTNWLVCCNRFKTNGAFTIYSINYQHLQNLPLRYSTTQKAQSKLECKYWKFNWIPVWISNHFLNTFQAKN